MSKTTQLTDTATPCICCSFHVNCGSANTKVLAPVELCTLVDGAVYRIEPKNASLTRVMVQTWT